MNERSKETYDLFMIDAVVLLSLIVKVNKFPNAH